MGMMNDKRDEIKQLFLSGAIGPLMAQVRLIEAGWVSVTAELFVGAWDEERVWSGPYTSTGIPDYLAKSAALLHQAQAAAEQRWAAKKDSDDSGVYAHAYYMQLKEISAGFERLAAIERGIAPGGYMSSTRLTQELSGKLSKDC